MEEQIFTIENDKSADWAIERIAEQERERDRLIDLANVKIEELESQIKELREKCDRDTAYLKSCLYEYFVKVPHKATKTQETYKLLSGSLVMKKPSFKINHNDEELIKVLDGTEFVETKKSLKWGEFKKNLMVNEDNVVIDTTTGEVIEACSVEDVPGSFDIKYKEA